VSICVHLWFHPITNREANIVPSRLRRRHVMPGEAGTLFVKDTRWVPVVQEPLSF